MKKTNDKFSLEHQKYIKKIKRDNAQIIFFRFFILIVFLSLWELFAHFDIIDSFLFSCPSKIVITIKNLFINNNLLYHIYITLSETLLGFIISSILGYFIALLLWWSAKVRKILEPYIVVLNSLPKIALGPIIIVWFGSGSKSIIFMTVMIGIIVAIITMENAFLSTDNNKILLLKSMGANKFQILLKLVVPQSLPTLISMLKVNVGLSWIGSIMGEYLVSKAGLGYLIVYGGQVFKLDLVMASTIILCILATIMYALVSLLEKVIIKYKSVG